MADDQRSIREREIEDAVYKLLETDGFADVTIRSIARAAKASNETLYRWYGDKLGLYRALIDRNAQQVAQSLGESRQARRRGLDALREVTPRFLEILLGDRYVALNKAAVSDRTGALAATLACSGRQAVIPMIIALLEEAVADGDFADEQGQPPPIDELFEAWATLVIGDLLALRLIGAMPALPRDEADRRARIALDRLAKVYPKAPG